ncbi:MAG: amidohydrolase family protein [Haloarculaceae archaeon]
MRIDSFAHVVPKGYYEALGDVHASYAWERHPTAGFWDYEQRVADLDEFGIDRQVIMLGGPHLFAEAADHADEETMADLMRAANDQVREIADEYPDRFVPVGTVPFLHDDLGAEFRRCIEDLDMAGIQMFTNYDGRPVDDEELHVLYDLATEYDVPLWLHPQVHDWYDWTDQWGVNMAFGWLFDTTLALTRLVFSGLLERYPDLKLVTHHGGGSVPHFMERAKLFFHEGGAFQDTAKMFQGGYEELTRPVDEYYTQFYADTVVYGSDPALRTLYEVFGPDQLLFGTDYPYGGNAGRDFMRTNTEVFERLDVPDDERAAIAGGNLEALIDV